MKFFPGKEKKYSFFSIACLFILMMIGCEQQTAEPVEMGYFFYPDTPGHWVVYDVDSVVYDDFTGEMYTYQYQVKELVESTFTDGEGKPGLRLERYWRHDQADSWVVSNIWQARRLTTRLEKTEENISYIKLTFPVKKNATWDGNAYNSSEPLTYRFTEVYNPLQLNGFSFDTTATVLQKQLYTLISEDFQQEIFAKDVGMIYKKYVKLTREVDGTIVGGIDYSYSIFDFGME